MANPSLTLLLIQLELVQQAGAAQAEQQWEH
jgi:hypothetical protein